MLRKVSSAGLLFTKNFTPLPIKGVKIFSWLPAYNILSTKKDVPTKPKPAEPAWQPYFQQYSSLPVTDAKRSRGGGIFYIQLITS